MVQSFMEAVSTDMVWGSSVNDYSQQTLEVKCISSALAHSVSIELHRNCSTRGDNIVTVYSLMQCKELIS